MIQRLADRPAGASEGIPALPTPQVSAVLVTLRAGADPALMAARFATSPDVTVYSADDQKGLLLAGPVNIARRQWGLFRVLLILISTLIMADEPTAALDSHGSAKGWHSARVWPVSAGPPCGS
ncbi:MAG: hypothetical protein IT580_19000 [Verrucomicrobiales bacterium]|nr:hypothetical protein [Verrucomicrobiales bacterium]